MGLGESKPVVTIREAINGYIVCHSYTSGSGRRMKYNTDEYVFSCKEEAFALAEDLL